MIITKKELEKIKKICFNLAKKYKKISYNGCNNDFELYFNNKIIYALFLHWANDSGTGIRFLFKNNYNILNKNDWEFIDYEDTNYPQINSAIYQIKHPYNPEDYIEIKVED